MAKIDDDEIQRRIRCGLIVSGPWTWHVRQQINAVGGHWHVPQKCWLLPDRKSMLAVLALAPDEEPAAPPPAPKANPYTLPGKVQAETRQANTTLAVLEQWWDTLDDDQRDTVREFVRRQTMKVGPIQPPTVEAVPVAHVVMSSEQMRDRLARARKEGLI